MSKKHSNLAIFALLALLVTTNQLCFAQSNSANQSPPKQTQISAAEKAKQTVGTIGIGNKITVIRLGGQEFYGSVRSIDADGFQIYEVDQKHTVDFKYDQLQGVRKGYGGKGYGGKRIAHSTRNGLILGAALLGGLLLLVTFGTR